MTKHSKINKRTRRKASFSFGGKYYPIDLLAQSGQWLMRMAIQAGNRGDVIEARRYYKLALRVALRLKR